MEQSQGTNSQQQEVTRRWERAQRILDAATVLILRWGYNKTTIDDIAREAGVAKGTIYLHWKTREELFASLIRREKLELAEDIRLHIAADPEGATLRGIVKHSALAIMRRPLMKAILLHDIEVLGKLAQNQPRSASSSEGLAGFNAYLELLHELGLTRSDLSLQKQVYIFSAIFTGFFLAAPLLPNALVPDDEELAELMAETVHRTLEPAGAASAEVMQTASHAFLHYLEHGMELAHKEFQQAVETESSKRQERSK